MDDLISRQAAINEVERAKVLIHHSVERAIGNAIIEILDDLEGDIRRIKPAQPEKRTEEHTKTHGVRLYRKTYGD